MNWRVILLSLPIVVLVFQAISGFIYTTTTTLDGRYFSLGKVQLKDGKLIDVSHSLRVVDGRFYAVTRKGDAIMETSGAVEYRIPDKYRLRVEKGEARSLASLANDELAFDLLYAQNEGSVINLVRMETCLYGQETRQVYCP
jgi:hypothetical protein